MLDAASGRFCKLSYFFWNKMDVVMAFSNALHYGPESSTWETNSGSITERSSCKGLMEAHPKDATELDKAEWRDVSKDVTGNSKLWTNSNLFLFFVFG